MLLYFGVFAVVDFPAVTGAHAFAGTLLFLMSMHAVSLQAFLSLKHNFVFKLNNFLCLHKFMAGKRISEMFDDQRLSWHIWKISGLSST